MGCSQSTTFQSPRVEGRTKLAATADAVAIEEDDTEIPSSLVVGEGNGENLGGTTLSSAEAEAEDPTSNWDLRFSDLKIEEHIASGAYCTVLACVLNGECRAVKLPLASCPDPEGAIIDLENEIRILKRLRHPHLCSVYGGGGWQGGNEMPFLVLERLQYKNLAQQLGTDVDDTSIRTRIRQRRARVLFPFRRRLQLGLQLAKLLRYLHRWVTCQHPCGS